jgi:hypothetical protein
LQIFINCSLKGGEKGGDGEGKIVNKGRLQESG